MDFIWTLVPCLMVFVPISAVAQLEEANDEIEIELKQGKVTARLSPDGQKAVWVQHNGSSSTIFVSTPDGSMTRKLVKTGVRNVNPYWLSDSKRLVYLDGNRRKQVFEVQLNGRTRALTDREHGCRMLIGGPDGIAAWQALYAREGKAQPADVIVLRNNKSTTVLEKTFVTDMKFPTECYAPCRITTIQCAFQITALLRRNVTAAPR